MIFDFIEWDEHNLDHATRRLTAIEIEQVIWNADQLRKHRVTRIACCSRPLLTVARRLWSSPRACATVMESDRSRRGRRNDERLREHEQNQRGRLG